jgi:hypothetical protein
MQLWQGTEATCHSRVNADFPALVKLQMTATPPDSLSTALQDTQQNHSAKPFLDSCPAKTLRC